MNDVKLLLKESLNLKRDVYDTLIDLCLIYSIQLDDFYTDDLDWLKIRRNKLCCLKIDYNLLNSIYIVTNLDYCPLVLVDISDQVYENIKANYKFPFTGQPYKITELNSARLFMFKSGNLDFVEEIHPEDVARLMGIFAKENLVSFAKDRRDFFKGFVRL
ncbi:MAG: hypothetical protein K2M82_03745 [Lachnospiraceae bacterium]|nr:hypothetical protein [Lachnospiraceae bacterium]